MFLDHDVHCEVAISGRVDVQWHAAMAGVAGQLAALGVAGENIAAGDVWVATGADGQIAGSSRSRPAMRQVRWT